MGTWITHIRIAENLLNSIEGLDPNAFAFGNLAPDSGIPNEDWSKFDPPKAVTHFRTIEKRIDRIRDLDYYKEYLASFSLTDKSSYSFRLGYFCHLLCDNLWRRKIGIPTAQFYKDEIKANRNQAWENIKDDWYALDHSYLKQHPNSLFWKSISINQNPKKLLPFLTQKSFNFSLNFIRDYYLQPNQSIVLNRNFPYLNETTLNRFVDETTIQIRDILSKKEKLLETIGTTSLILLSEAQKSSYKYPLGDTL